MPSNFLNCTMPKHIENTTYKLQECSFSTSLQLLHFFSWFLPILPDLFPFPLFSLSLPLSLSPSLTLSYSPSLSNSLSHSLSKTLSNSPPPPFPLSLISWKVIFSSHMDHILQIILNGMWKHKWDVPCHLIAWITNENRECHCLLKWG